jgi:hypothetical protein
MISFRHPFQIIRKIPAISFFYLLLAVSLFGLIRGHVRYAGVGDWPKVKAYDINQSGTTWSQPIQTQTGSGTASFDTRQADFRYIVNGVEYHGTRWSPNGGAPLLVHSEQLYAYYNPKNPAIAVLAPYPYHGLGWIASSGFAGLFVAVHLILHFRAF